MRTRVRPPPTTAELRVRSHVPACCPRAANRRHSEHVLRAATEQPSCCEQPLNGRPEQGQPTVRAYAAHTQFTRPQRRAGRLWTGVFTLRVLVQRVSLSLSRHLQ